MRKRSSLRFALLPAVAAVVLSVGCENAVTLPTPPDQTQGYDVYFGPLDPGGRSVYLVTLDQATTTQVMLAGVVLDNPFRSVNQALTVSFGGFDGTQCTDLEAVETTPRFTAAIQRFLLMTFPTGDVERLDTIEVSAMTLQRWPTQLLQGIDPR